MDRNSNILILGSTGFIGSRLAIYLVRRGYNLVLHGRDKNSLKVLVNKLHSFQHNICMVATPIFNDHHIEYLKKHVSKCVSSLDAIISTLGVWDDTDINKLSYNLWFNVINSNLIAPIQSIINLYDLLKTNGTVVMLSCLTGIRGHRIYKGLSPSIPYVASKSALISVVKQLAEYMARKNIKVIAIAPSWISKDAITKTLYRNIEDTVPLKRPGYVDELIDLIHMLITRNITYITGAVIEFSGGL